MKNILVTNIQRFSLHDGPGIRTTVFLKGCSLRCPWCSNPENLIAKKQRYIKNGSLGEYGKYYEPDELYKEIIKDHAFYKGEIKDFQVTDPSQLDKLPGGVTFSGGEALLQMEWLEPLLIKLKYEKVHTVIETCLFASQRSLDLALKYIDLFYVDVKILDETLCQKYLGRNIQEYLNNLNILMQSGKPIVIRIPVIGGYTDGAKNRKAVLDLLSKFLDKFLKVELIKEHRLGEKKYQSLIEAGNRYIVMPNYSGVSDEVMENYKKEIEQLGVWTEICKI